MTLYFAFGSNMDFSQMSARCPSAHVVGIGQLLENALGFPHFSIARQCAVAGYRLALGKSVWGVIYDVSETDLAYLDTFEGFSPSRDRTLNKYNRVQINIVCNAQTLNCMTYQATPHDAPGLTSRHYLGQLISGARHHGLPVDYVAFLEEFKTLD